MSRDIPDFMTQQHLPMVPGYASSSGSFTGEAPEPPESRSHAGVATSTDEMSTVPHGAARRRSRPACNARPLSECPVCTHWRSGRKPVVAPQLFMTQDGNPILRPELDFLFDQPKGWRLILHPLTHTTPNRCDRLSCAQTAFELLPRELLMHRWRQKALD